MRGEGVTESEFARIVREGQLSGERILVNAHGGDSVHERNTGSQRTVVIADHDDGARRCRGESVGGLVEDQTISRIDGKEIGCLDIGGESAQTIEQFGCVGHATSLSGGTTQHSIPPRPAGDQFDIPVSSTSLSVRHPLHDVVDGFAFGAESVHRVVASGYPNEIAQTTLRVSSIPKCS